MLCCFLSRRVLPLFGHSSSFCLQVSLIVKKVSVFVFEPAQLLDDLVDLVVARQRACIFEPSCCDRALVPVDLGRLLFYDLALVVWLCCFCVFVFAVELLRVGLVVVFRGGVAVLCSCGLLYFHRRTDRHVSMY